MRRLLSIATLALASLVLAACSHKATNTPLAFVPANTPYVIANLKPLKADARKALLAQFNTPETRALRVNEIRAAARHLANHGKQNAANLLQAFATSVAGKTYAQVAAEMGIDQNGLFALYGLGLSPVIRGQLSDAAKFHAYINKLEKAYGHDLTSNQIAGASYQSAKLGDTGLQVILATHAKQYVIALLPAAASTTQLKLALGVTKPATSLATSGHLEDLADTNGYQPYLLGDIDTTKLPALLAGLKDPLLQALVKHAPPSAHAGDLAQALPEACEPGLARIAARVPSVAFGYTSLKAKDQAWQIDVGLAPDIVTAFKDAGTAVPGLAQVNTDAGLGFGLSLPIPTIRQFWLAQAESVQSKPFMCPALASLNKSFRQLQKVLPKTAMPPLNALRGFKLVIDRLDLGKAGQPGQESHPEADARLLVASANPTGLLMMAKALLPSLGSIQIKPDGKPMALPPALTATVHEPAWLALNNKAIAIGIGASEEAEIGTMLTQPSAPAGTASHALVSGSFYAHWMGELTKDMAGVLVDPGNSPRDQAARAALARAKARLAASQATFKRIDRVTWTTGMTAHGLRISGETIWKP